MTFRFDTDKAQLTQHMFSELESPSKELTEWETSFIESVSDFYTNRGFLTEAQFLKLESIYAEKTS